MITKTIGESLVLTLLVAYSYSAGAQEQKKRTGKFNGEIKSTKPSPNGKNAIIEVLAPGEEKARSYRVQYDPKAKGADSIRARSRPRRQGRRSRPARVDRHRRRPGNYRIRGVEKGGQEVTRMKSMNADAEEYREHDESTI